MKILHYHLPLQSRCFLPLKLRCFLSRKLRCFLSRKLRFVVSSPAVFCSAAFHSALILSALFVVLSLNGCGGDSQQAPPPPKVAAISVIQADIPIYGEVVGQTIGSVDVAVRARVDGQVLGFHFKEGTRVKKGDLLYTIDPQPFEAKRISAQGRLAEAKTRLAKAEADLKRIEPLAKIDAVSQRDLDAAIAQKGAAEASVESAEADLEYAQIELSYTKIMASIDGLIGISAAKVGDYVGKDPNPVVLNVISQIDPIHVRATFSESDYLQFAKRQIKEHGDARAPREEQKKPLELILADGSKHKSVGKIYAVNNQVDPTTGTLTLEATFPNNERLLRPGQFAKIRFVKEMRKDALVVWQRAVQELQSIYQVYVVTSDSKVEVRQVKVGEKTEGVWIIEEGLKPGERVIVDGLQKVRPDIQVAAMSPKELGVIPPESPLLAQLDKSKKAL